MSSMGAVYAKIPAGGVSELEEAVKKARAVSRHSSPLGVLAFDPACPTYAIVDRWGRSDNMPIWSEGPDLATALELVELSRLVGEVIAFYEIDEGLAMGVYGTWRNGVLVRDLLWCNDQWATVEGEPQAWEKTLFRTEAMETALQNARDDGGDEAAIKAVFEAGRIIRGASFPVPDGLSGHIWRVLPGPAYGFSPWPKRQELVEKNRAERGMAKPSR